MSAANAHSGNVARRHHYVPQFYLRAWNASDGKGLWVYNRDVRGNLRARRCAARSIGFAEDLYALLPDTAYPALNHPPDAVEKEFFARLDDDAARVHRKLVTSGIRELSPEDRGTWALFVNSLLERGPDQIHRIEQEVSEDELIHDLRLKFGSSDLSDKFDLTAMRKNAVRTALIDYIRDEPFVRHVATMQWATIDLGTEGEHFVTSDRPVLKNGASGGYPIHCLSMALSPSRMLVMHGDSNNFDEAFIRTLAAIHNIFIIRQTRQYLISSAKLMDGPHTKYSKAVLELAKTGN